MSTSATDDFFENELNADINYMILRDEPFHCEDRENFNIIWNTVKDKIRDRKFKTKAKEKDQFRAAAWHVALLYVFHEIGYQIDTYGGNSEPDIKLKINNQTIFIEATTLKSGNDILNSVPERLFGKHSPTYSKGNDHRYQLRVTNTIDEKFGSKDSQYNRQKKKIPEMNTSPYVLAMTTTLPDAELQKPVEKVLFGKGKDVYHIGLDQNYRIIDVTLYSMDENKIQKKKRSQNGEDFDVIEIDKGIFDDPSFELLSGVIWTPYCPCRNFPLNVEEYLASIRYFANPRAKYPCPENFWSAKSSNKTLQRKGLTALVSTHLLPSHD